MLKECLKNQQNIWKSIKGLNEPFCLTWNDFWISWNCQNIEKSFICTALIKQLPPVMIYAVIQKIRPSHCA